MAPLECHRAELEVTPFPGGTLEWSAGSEELAPPAPGVLPRSLRWSRENIRSYPAAQPVGFVQNKLLVNVRCVPTGLESTMTWQKLGHTVAAVTDPQIDPSGEVKALALKLVAGESDRLDRIRALAAFVQHEVVYLAIDLDRDSLEGIRPHAAAEVLRNRFGDCKDKANLLLSLLRAVGEDGRLVLLDGAGNPTTVNPKWPTYCFNHAIVAIAVGPDAPPSWPTVSLSALGRSVVFDPTQANIPLGILAPGDQGGYGLLVDPDQAEVFKFPLPGLEDPTSVRSIACAIDSDGALKVHSTEEELGFAGAGTYDQRARLTKEEYGKGIERRVDRLTPSATIESWSESWDPVGSRFRLELDYAATIFGARRTNGMLMIAPTAFLDMPRLPAWGTPADGTVFLLPENLRAEIVLTKPAGFRVEEIPDAFASDLGGTRESLHYTEGGAKVTCVMSVIRRGGFYSREEYEQLREAARQLIENAKHPVIFIRADGSAK